MNKRTKGVWAGGAGAAKFLWAITAVAALVFGARPGASAQTPSNSPTVVRLDPKLDEIVSPDAQLQVVKSGFGFSEGPVWVQHGKTGYLVFSDIPANVVDKMTPDGTVSVYLEQSGYHGPWNGYAMMSVGHVSNNRKDRNDPDFREWIQVGSDGLAIDPQGRLVFCTYSGRTVEKLEKDGKRTVLADSYDGKRLNGPNDVVVTHEGTIYFTDMYGGLHYGKKDRLVGLDFSGVFMIKDGKVTPVVKDIPQVNGIALSPDEKYLYVNGDLQNFINRYDIQPDGTVTNGKLIIDMSADKTKGGNTDGLKVDSQGNIYSSGPGGGVWIISPDGQHLGTIQVPTGATNFCFGDPDYKTLYIAGHSTIYKIRMNAAGPHWGEY